jgi:glycine oxidase
MPQTFDAIVLGAGISGLSAAREMSRRGLNTVVLERDIPCSHASLAAAGILVSRGVVRSEVAGRMFYTRSLESYADWVRMLAEESGHPVPLRAGDDWCLFCHGGRADRFRQRLERESDPSRWEEVDELPVGLRGSVSRRPWRIFRFPDERWCVPDDLMRALLGATVSAGALVVGDCGETHIRDIDGNWQVDTAKGSFEAPVAIAAAGPWTGRILAKLGWDANLVSVRGQLALVPRLHALDAMVHLEDTFYAVPRGEYTLVGATVEHGEWAESTTEKGLAELQSRLRTVFPRLDLAKATKVWAGLRPRTRDRVPHLGWLEPGRLLVASGHYRSGISMAPRNGQVVADLVAGGQLPSDAQGLDPLRSSGGYRRIR